MKIKLKEVTVGEVANGYIDNDVEGCFGYDGNLNIRPPYQREFVYNDKKRNAVVATVRQGFPLNVMYWNKVVDKNNKVHYEILDGQQRTISICQFVNNEFSVDYKYMHSLTENERKQILNYPLMIYVCEGTETEKLEWFKTINIAGEELTPQELKNAVYVGPWLTDAKKHFSKPQNPAQDIASKLMKGKPIRQDYLATTLKWISEKENIDIREYMSYHQQDPNCNELWLYFTNVVNWVKTLFPKYRKEMKGIDWGILYNHHHTEMFDAATLEKEIETLMLDDEVTKKKGIYPYLITKEEKYLSLREFTPSMKSQQYAKQKGFCNICHKHFDPDEMEADHITPWSQGGKTIMSNLQLLCRDCNRRKSNH